MIIKNKRPTTYQSRPINHAKQLCFTQLWRIYITFFFYESPCKFRLTISQKKDKTKQRMQSKTTSRSQDTQHHGQKKYYEKVN